MTRRGICSDWCGAIEYGIVKIKIMFSLLNYPLGICNRQYNACNELSVISVMIIRCDISYITVP